MNIKDKKKAIEAVKRLRNELVQNYSIWNSKSFEEFNTRASQTLADQGIPELLRQESSSQSSSAKGPPYAIVQSDLNGNGMMTTSDGEVISSSDNLLTKIERVKDALDAILEQLGYPVSQDD